MRTTAARRRWEETAEEAAGCTRCPLYADATATVFGEGPVPATIMLVGEQPGDREDLAGRPFVGPAGALLDRCIEDAGGRREEMYLTNAVKHFKFHLRGKRRIHETPDRTEIDACGLWLDRELEVVSPRLVVFLGATAAQSRLGRSFRVTKQRGQPVDSDLAEHVVATVHPSSILRGSDDARHDARLALVADLRSAFALVEAAS
ncbi:MAG TPA: UdgX family uracil-DNA binding protein [Iamia sp.]|nr:UdgX family uracil-DNA binding protein [Iamia sp.]